MAEAESGEKEPSGGRARLIALAARQVSNQTPPPPLLHGAAGPVSFDRQELNQILTVYGRHVAEGDWRDYAIDNLRDSAVFSIYRRTSETPLYRIVKQRIEAAGGEIVMPLVGRYATSMEMAGVSFTLCWLNEERERLLKAPADCAFWRV